MTAGCAIAALGLASQATALTILPTFDSSITGASNALAIEGAINFAASAIGNLFSNTFSAPILFEAVHNGTNSYLAASESTFYSSSYSAYAGLLKQAAAANPSNTILKSAAANLAYGNKGGPYGIVATNTVFDALGLSLAGGYDANANFVGTGTYDGVVFINLDQPFSYTQPVPTYNGSNLTYDATRAMEHEIDEVLGGGGSGSTLNDIADYGRNNPNDSFTYYEGALDLYRYMGPHQPSFSLSTTVRPYFSVDGGKTSIVGFNQYAQGDFGDFGPTSYSCSGGGYGGPPGLIQDAFSCPNQTGEAFTSSSPEYKMLESLGYDPLTSALQTQGALCCSTRNGGSLSTPVPERSTWAMMLAGFASLAAYALKRRPASLRSVRMA
jgi:hypothetical protein